MYTGHYFTVINFAFLCWNVMKWLLILEKHLEWTLKIKIIHGTACSTHGINPECTGGRNDIILTYMLHDVTSTSVWCHFNLMPTGNSFSVHWLCWDACLTILKYRTILNILAITQILWKLDLNASLHFLKYILT